MKHEQDPPGVYLPSPEEIARETAAIRAGWSEAERLRRIVGGPDQQTIERGYEAWEVPAVKTPTFR